MTSTIKDAPASPAGGVRARPAGLAGAVYAALATVRDPELDQPVTTLGFVSSCTVTGEGAAQVRLRLPTYFCAPNFAFLMVADAYDAVTAVPGVTAAEVILDDHFASDAINAGVAARAGFVASFDGEATDELDDLRATFLRKAVLAGTDQVCRPLVDRRLHARRAGRPDPRRHPGIARTRPPQATPPRPRSPRRRHQPPPLDPATGNRIPESSVPFHLRRARLTRTGIDANTSICSGMLKARYQTT